MRVHSILFVEARKAVAMAGGVTVRSRHGVLLRLTNGWNARRPAYRSHARMLLASRDDTHPRHQRARLGASPQKFKPNAKQRFPRLPECDWTSGRPADHAFRRASARMRAAMFVKAIGTGVMTTAALVSVLSASFLPTGWDLACTKRWIRAARSQVRCWLV